MSAERWADMPGMETRYAVSSWGRVYAYPKTVRKFSAICGQEVDQHYKGRFLTPVKSDSFGHMVVHIGSDKKSRNISVHRLVLLAFVGPCPDGMEACHNNGIAWDNRLENLRWDTHKANNLDRKNHGRYANGEQHHQAKFDKQTITAVRAGALSLKQSGMSRTHYYRVRNGEAWKNV